MAQQAHGGGVVSRSTGALQLRNELVNSYPGQRVFPHSILVPKQYVFQGGALKSQLMFEAFIKFQMASQELPATSSSSSTPWRENTEDLDALLESDEEADSESVTSNCNGMVAGDEHGYFSSEGETDGSKEEEEEEQQQQQQSSESYRRHRHSWDSLSVRRLKGKNKDLSRTRRWKIKERMSTLKKIIPDGRTKGTAFVLEEAIRYIRTLQAMVGERQ